MRYINRPEEDMLVAQAELNRTGKYNCPEVKRYLSETYRGICAYCECEVEVSNYLEIEHFHPKSHYEGLETDIHNLHLSCKRCNNPKGSKTDTILSPNYYLEDPNALIPTWSVTDDQELNNKIRYCGHMLYSPSDEDITKNTISILRLNNDKDTDKRERLIESRLQVYDQAYSFFAIAINSIASLAEKYKKTALYYLYNFGLECSFMVDLYNDSYRTTIEDTLKRCSGSLVEMMEHGHPYSQMIIDNFADPLKQLLAITQRLDWNVSFNDSIIDELETVIPVLNDIKAKVKHL